MKLIKFEIGETDLYAFREDKGINAKVFYDRQGKRKIYCDLHKRTQLLLSLYDEFTGMGYDYDMPFCPKCVRDNIKEYDDMDYIRIPYIDEAKF